MDPDLAALSADIALPSELRRVMRQLEYAQDRAADLRRRAAADPAFALKADSADVRVAILRARAAQLRRGRRPAAPTGPGKVIQVRLPL
jgi:hypothetical protein